MRPNSLWLSGLQWRHRADVALIALLAIGAAYCAWVLTGLHDHITILRDARADDVWFEGDVDRVFGNMTDRFSNHFRSQVHPVFSLFALVGTRLFGSLFGVSKLTAVRLVIASAAALWMALFFILLRLLRCRQLDATLFCLVAATSASAIFWTAVPETYVLASATIVAVLATTALAERQRIPPWLDVAMAAAALSVLITNWMVALISLGIRHKLKDALQLAANALVVIVLLWAIQKFMAPSAHFFIGDREKLTSVEPLTVPSVFFLDTLVMPHVQMIANDHPWLWPKFSVQHAFAWKLTAFGLIALVAWATMLGAGAWAMFKVQHLKKFRLFLIVALVGQLTLHLLFGNETFLYALDWMPLLVTVAALATLTRLRWVTIAAALVFIVSASQHNLSELRLTFDVLSSRVSMIQGDH